MTGSGAIIDIAADIKGETEGGEMIELTLWQFGLLIFLSLPGVVYAATILLAVAVSLFIAVCALIETVIDAVRGK